MRRVERGAYKLTLISDVENILDDVIFINKGQISLQASVDDIREQYGKSVDGLFREVFKC